MRVRTFVAAAVCAPLLTIAGAGAAAAGEVTGPSRDGFADGDINPIAGYVANSICAFSGLNAYHDGKDPVFPTVQSYGMGVRAGLKGSPYLPSPGVACNGHTRPGQRRHQVNGSSHELGLRRSTRRVQGTGLHL